MLGLGNSLITRRVLSGFTTPADLPGIIHWWKSNDGMETAAGETSAAGDIDNTDQIIKWEDQIGSEHFVGTSNLPTYDAPTGTLNFGGASKILTITSGTSSDIELDADFAIYIRIKFKATPSSSDIFFKDTDTSNEFFRVQNTTTLRAKIASTALNFTIPTLDTSDFYNIGLERSGEDVRVYVDGDESSTGAISNSLTWSIDTLKGGLSDYFSTMIIVKGSALSVENRGELETYLAALNG